ncbi:branched-chain amino acid transaminase [Longimicrobium sp.]|uniref:branched-chain amino acid transaminase n=1 Tax=Longimicrobium sp. TaxID=2029185 RepID=UPI002C9DC908|nr:branched-chain amino acid transaminase [Longimicrobium sp.]HSU17601.1 branched-chain amino acid transaminase [Longimicrobium sp.]
MSTANGPTRLIWRDGQLIDWRDATIHVMSHVAHYGSCVFEGIRCYETSDGPAIFRLQDHMRRLLDSARIYRIPCEHTLESLSEAAVEVVAANGVKHCYLRPLIARTGEQMGILADDRFVETFVVAWIWGTYLGEGALENGVDACISSWRRAAPDTFPSLGKAGGAYLNSQLAKMEAKDLGFHEAIMLDTYGYVAEGTGQNLFVVRDGVLFTPPISANILAGITRDSVIRIARDLGYEVREENLPREFVYIADEAFFTGTAAELTPLRSVDRIPVGAGRRGPVTGEIQDRFLGIARGEVPDTYGWLTHVPAHAEAAA